MQQGRRGNLATSSINTTNSLPSQVFTAAEKWSGFLNPSHVVYNSIPPHTHLQCDFFNYEILVLVQLFNPLQGMLNILVFTRPHVAKERTKNPSLSWWGAFKKVVASGGDDDDERTNRLRRGVMAAAASARSAASAR
jgi:hypothetical protein